MRHADPYLLHADPDLSTVKRARRWWRRLSPQRQDRVAMLAPLAAVVLFMAAIVSALLYLQIEEADREQEGVRRDVEYTQQQLRLRLLERQEQFGALGRELSSQELDARAFRLRVIALLNQYPEVHGAAWLDAQRRLRASGGATFNWSYPVYGRNAVALDADGEYAFKWAAAQRQVVYLMQPKTGAVAPLLQLFIPLVEKGQPAGVILAELSIDGLYRYGIPNEIAARYGISLLDAKGNVVAGVALPIKRPVSQILPWTRKPSSYSMAVSPVGSDLLVRAEAYRASMGVIGTGLFWLVSALSVMTAWMLIANWRHSRKRLQAQQALLAETNFRRAMENSMLTGMRAMDLQGRITYVNAAFCMMTGWSESELVGRTAPFPYWPDSDRDELSALLGQELSGKTSQGGIQVRVKRRDGTLFDARMYVAPLIDAMGTQTGWVTSMTDITEPNRVREQLSASHQRFTTVLEALDASISVAPLGSDELVFANKLYRQWFGTAAGGHLQLVAEAGVPQARTNHDISDDVDLFAGLPMNTLGKWMPKALRFISAP